MIANVIFVIIAEIVVSVSWLLYGLRTARSINIWILTWILAAQHKIIELKFNLVYELKVQTFSFNLRVFTLGEHCRNYIFIYHPLNMLHVTVHLHKGC